MNTAADTIIRRWLIAAAVAVVLAVMIGGITRLTESGLSITEWLPVSGMIPPTSDADWQSAYQKFLAIPQAQTVHRGITMDDFKTIFWWEWMHRNLARIVGLVIAVPYFVFLWRGLIRPTHRWRLLLLPVLTAAQGALGWYMVSSGLDVRTSVSPYRLTAHLGMALLIYAISIWTYLELRPGSTPRAASEPQPLRRWTTVALVLTVITLLSGGFVAGLDAGMMYNTFPLMGGQVVPPGYVVESFGWRNALENPVAVQFHHRVLAIITAVTVLLLAVAARRRPDTASLRPATDAAAVLVLLQVGLGIATLLTFVPVTLGVMHQVTGVAVLTAMLVVCSRGRQSAAIGRKS